ncbi:MAG: hypothetical protein M1834_004935 [Cirrosporium novae-zelandiae]|nr:MAG: hypothetical protein M1834_004935 [Cirrosporium novae-zelandiae]
MLNLIFLFLLFTFLNQFISWKLAATFCIWYAIPKTAPKVIWETIRDDLWDGFLREIRRSLERWLTLSLLTYYYFLSHKARQETTIFSSAIRQIYSFVLNHPFIISAITLIWVPWRSTIYYVWAVNNRVVFDVAVETYYQTGLLPKEIEDPDYANWFFHIAATNIPGGLYTLYFRNQVVPHTVHYPTIFRSFKREVMRQAQAHRGREALELPSYANMVQNVERAVRIFWDMGYLPYSIEDPQYLRSFLTRAAEVIPDRCYDELDRRRQIPFQVGYPTIFKVFGRRANEMVVEDQREALLEVLRQNEFRSFRVASIFTGLWIWMLPHRLPLRFEFPFSLRDIWDTIWNGPFAHSVSYWFLNRNLFWLLRRVFVVLLICRMFRAVFFVGYAPPEDHDTIMRRYEGSGWENAPTHTIDAMWASNTAVPETKLSVLEMGTQHPKSTMWHLNEAVVRATASNPTYLAADEVCPARPLPDEPPLARLAPTTGRDLGEVLINTCTNNPAAFSGYNMEWPKNIRCRSLCEAAKNTPGFLEYLSNPELFPPVDLDEKREWVSRTCTHCVITAIRHEMMAPESSIVAETKVVTGLLELCMTEKYGA